MISNLDLDLKQSKSDRRKKKEKKKEKREEEKKERKGKQKRRECPASFINSLSDFSFSIFCLSRHCSKIPTGWSHGRCITGKSVSLKERVTFSKISVGF